MVYVIKCYTTHKFYMTVKMLHNKLFEVLTNEKQSKKSEQIWLNNVCIKYNRTFSIVKKQQQIGWGSSQQWCNDLRESFLNNFFSGSCVIFAGYL